MLALRIILMVLSFIAAIISGKSWGKTNRLIHTIIATIATIAFTVAYSILLCVTNWSTYAVPIIITLVCINIATIIFSNDPDGDLLFVLLFIVAIISAISFGVGYAVYQSKIVPCDKKDVSSKSYTLVSASDDFNTKSEIHGSTQGWFILAVGGSHGNVDGSTSVEPVYNYYYQQDDGGIKMGTLTADNSVTLYYLKDGEKPHIDVITTTTYKHNENDDTYVEDESKKTYKFYIPEGTIKNDFAFDLN